MDKATNKMFLTDGLKIKSENINLLRFLAALLVIFGHSFALTTGDLDPISSLTGDLCSCGGLAVAILFFLSGLYVSASLKRQSASETRSPLKTAWTFMKRRCDRIFPQLWAVVLLTVVALGAAMTVLPLSKYFTSVSTWKYMLNAALIPIHNLPGVFELNRETTVNGALWTMPVEFVAYCFLAGVAFIALTAKKKTLMHLAHWAGLAVSLAAFIYFSLQANGFMMRVFRPVALFMIGALYCDYSDKIALNRIVGLIALLLLALSSITPFFNYVLMITLPYAIVSLCLASKQIHSLGLIGKISYEMYLMGVPIQQTVVALFNNNIAPWLLFLIAAAVDILLACILFKTIDFIDGKVKAKFKSKKEKSA